MTLLALLILAVPVAVCVFWIAREAWMDRSAWLEREAWEMYTHGR